jgi:hypothetical protein
VEALHGNLGNAGKAELACCPNGQTALVKSVVSAGVARYRDLRDG